MSCNVHGCFISGLVDSLRRDGFMPTRSTPMKSTPTRSTPIRSTPIRSTSHEVNSYQINSHHINFPRGQFPLKLLLAERLSARHLILQYNLAAHCMLVTHWNAIITAGISVTSLMITSAMCTYYIIILLLY